MSATPLTVIDHIGGKTMTLETEVDGKKIRQTIFHERLNWPGYEAVMSYVLSIIKRAEQSEESAETQGDLQV